MNRNTNVVVVDNRDSFVYNLVDTLDAGSHPVTVVRGTVPADEVMALAPGMLVLSPGPGHPSSAGSLPQIVAAAAEKDVPVLGICLGFQAILEHHGGAVAECGPVHGVTDRMRLSPAGAASPLFAGLADPATGTHVPVARYHSLGTTQVPAGLEALGWCDSEAGPVVMAACDDARAPREIGLQFHPESVLSPGGPILLHRCIDQLLEYHDHG